MQGFSAGCGVGENTQSLFADLKNLVSFYLFSEPENMKRDKAKENKKARLIVWKFCVFCVCKWVSQEGLCQNQHRSVMLAVWVKYLNGEQTRTESPSQGCCFQQAKATHKCMWIRPEKQGPGSGLARVGPLSSKPRCQGFTFLSCFLKLVSRMCDLIKP